MTNSPVDQANAAQRGAFVDDAQSRALDTLDNPKTPEAIERAWSNSHREGRFELDGHNFLTLWNFDVGSVALKSEHQRVLASFVVEQLAKGSTAQASSRFNITGKASITGSEQRNKTLAIGRAQTVLSHFVTRFGIPTSQISPGPDVKTEAGSTQSSDGESYARDRRVVIERILPPPVPPRSLRDPTLRDDQLQSGSNISESTLSPNLEFVTLYIEFRFPTKGEVDLKGWVTLFAKCTFKGKARLVREGSKTTITMKPTVAPRDDWKKKLAFEASAKITEGSKVKFSADVEKRSPRKGPPMSLEIQFDELADLENIGAGLDIKEIRVAPVIVSKRWKVPLQRLIFDDQPLELEGEIEAKLNLGLGQKAKLRLVSLGARAVTALAAGGTATGVGAIAAAIVVPVAIMAGTVKAIQMGSEEWMRRTHLIARRQGFALTVASQAIGLTPEVKEYAKAIQGGYRGIGDSAEKAFLGAQNDAITQLRNKVAFLDAVQATYGSDIGKCHESIFLELGGFDSGFGEIKVDDIPVQPATQK